ncbi:hypothetical protein HLB01_00145 [Bordetella trematum]|uniref:hypothetical protein n=1 Tax=Bordetella trematum TaxID=123899 RepID=UPI000F8F5B03|nr:hypothetical protein [Bordetella trematum]NNH17440.1 hypothetical protein [Bordetella trematum]
MFRLIFARRYRFGTRIHCLPAHRLMPASWRNQNNVAIRIGDDKQAGRNAAPAAFTFTPYRSGAKRDIPTPPWIDKTER